jgi:hypothetical protein
LEKSTIDILSPEVKSLLGGEESFQPKNYQQILRVGQKIQQLSPLELKYIYQPLAEQVAGNLDAHVGEIELSQRLRE